MMLPASPRFGRLERLWRRAEVWCATVVAYAGHRNGYVLVPEGHPWHGTEPDGVDVHGGLTFAERRTPADWERTLDAEAGDGIPGGWWIGFDCMHFRDARGSSLMNPTHRAFYERFPDPALGGHLWTADEVVSETERLADQVIAAGTVTTRA